MNSTNKLLGFVVFGLFVLTGTYNAVVINSESHINGSEIKFVKRLDELYGVTVPGREVAASVTWKKLAPAPVVANVPSQIIQPVSTRASAPAVAESSAPAETPAVVQEELALSLVEVINTKKWQNGLPANQFNGTLSTNQGVIENLSVSLPNGEGVSVSFSEMTGNVFEYDLDGELYSGMLYQVDQNAYMVTLTNGPLEGTRLRFSSQQPAEEQIQNQEVLAENNVDVGSFGNDQQAYEQQMQNEEKQFEQAQTELLNQNDQQMQMEAMQAQALNAENTQAM